MGAREDFEAQRNALVASLKAEGVLKSDSVIASMKKVARELFVPEGLSSYAYDDVPLPIEHGQTISAPHGTPKERDAGRNMVAIMDEAAQFNPGMNVLEIGAGSGYHAATIAEIVGPTGHVYTVEVVEGLVRYAGRNLERAGYSDRVTLVQGDGSTGYSDRAPYDRILVTAAAPDVPPRLVQQLKPGGILLIPVGGRFYFQQLFRIRKTESERLEKENLGAVAFVPLVGEQGYGDR